MDIYEAMSTLRAVRRIKSDPIDPAVIDRILLAATWAPTGGNMQPWRIVAVQDPAIKTEFQHLYKPLWDDYTIGYRTKMESMPADEKATSARALDAGDYLANNLGTMPLIAVFCYNPSIMAITDKDQPRTSVVGGGSVYPAVQNLLLAARNEGLGCVLTTLLCMEEPRVRELLQLPDDWYTAAHVPVGHSVGGGTALFAASPSTRWSAATPGAPLGPVSDKPVSGSRVLPIKETVSTCDWSDHSGG